MDELLKGVNIMQIGISEIILIIIVAFVVIGPEKTPYYAKKLGKLIYQVKNFSKDFENSLKDAIDDNDKDQQE